MSNQESEQRSQESIPLDTFYDLLAHERRRTVLSLLQEHRSLPLADLADEIAHDEYGKPISEVSNDEAQLIRASLWHEHIPKLAEAGVVEYDQERDVVKLTDTTDYVEEFLGDRTSASEETV